MGDKTRDSKCWKSARGLLLVVLAVIIIATFVYGIKGAVEAPRGKGVLTILPKFIDDLPPDEGLIGQAIMQNFIEYRHNTVLWSATYYSCLFFSAALSALAGLVLKLEFFLKNAELKKDIAAFLAMSAALLITLSTVGDFQKKWQANRLAAAQMENLAYEFITADRSNALTDFSLKIQEINMFRNQEVVGGERSSETRAPIGEAK
jgi:hypothetical protein